VVAEEEKKGEVHLEFAIRPREKGKAAADAPVFEKNRSVSWREIYGKEKRKVDKTSIRRKGGRRRCTSYLCLFSLLRRGERGREKTS